MLGITFVFGLWFVGLLAFVDSIPLKVEDRDTPTDTIVVLTGGSLRLREGFSLLQKGAAKTLFISGVNKSVLLRDLPKYNPLSKNHTDKVGLGHKATDTVGNAEETAEWMRKNKYKSLRLVTSNYHLPRSLVEVQSACPDALIISHPVFPKKLNLHSWWTQPSTATLIISEYSKFIVSYSRQAILKAFH
ncbi:MAG: YdcF family protein [Alphaproteobacteria bacterium]|nr:YdcF family protein [Alphaproteobacteria bacterium]MBT5390217.1 YdcF family protein [Alphaproteobacteria bacterium]